MDVAYSSKTDQYVLSKSLQLIDCIKIFVAVVR